MNKSPFIESVRSELRTRHYSIQTEKTYLYWIRHFITFNNKQHPKDMSNPEIEQFLNYLAVTRQVNAATQNQALCAIIFLYRYVIEREIVDLKYGFSKKTKQLPTVLSPTEVAAIISNLSGKDWLITALHGTGLRISEALFLRIKDIDLHNKAIFVFRGKGQRIAIPFVIPLRQIYSKLVAVSALYKNCLGTLILERLRYILMSLVIDELVHPARLTPF